VKTILRPGQEIETVTPSELEERLAELGHQIRSDERTMRPDGDGVTNAAGNGNTPIYQVPLGMQFNLHRLLVEADGFTPGAPYNAAAGWIDVLRGDERVDFLPLAVGSGAIPALVTYGTADAIRFRNGEVVAIALFGGPASTGFIGRAQGTLQPITTV